MCVCVWWWGSACLKGQVMTNKINVSPISRLVHWPYSHTHSHTRHIKHIHASLIAFSLRRGSIWGLEQGGRVCVCVHVCAPHQDVTSVSFSLLSSQLLRVSGCRSESCFCSIVALKNLTLFCLNWHFSSLSKEISTLIRHMWRPDRGHISLFHPNIQKQSIRQCAFWFYAQKII